MPANVPLIERVHDVASSIARQNAYMRAVVARSLKILQASVPDTFLGRKTQEPFPSEDYVEPEQRSRTTNEIDTAGSRAD